MSMDICKLRDEIDCIDMEILRLIEKRIEVVQKVGDLKHEKKSRIYVPEREEKIFETLANSSLKLEYEKIRGIYTEIISSCRDFEKKFTVLCQGELSMLMGYRVFGSIVDLVRVEKKGNIHYNDRKYDFILINKVNFVENEYMLSQDEYVISEINWVAEHDVLEYLLIGKLEKGKTYKDYTLNKIIFNGGLL